MDLTEKVASAILVAQFYDPEPHMYEDKGTFLAEIDSDLREEALHMARAAIAVCAEEMAKRLDEEGYDCMGFCANTLRSIGATNA